MAQDFRNVLQDDLPTSHNDTNSLLWTGGNYDAVIGIRVANILTTTVKVDIYVVRSTANYYLCKNTPIPPGGSKVVLASGDVLWHDCDTDNAIDLWVSYIDTISS